MKRFKGKTEVKTYASGKLNDFNVDLTVGRRLTTMVIRHTSIVFRMEP